jgi:hypothetical protein
MASKILLGPRGAGGVLFTLSTPLEAEDQKAATQRLEDLLQAAYPHAIDFWYPKKK